MPQKLAPFAPTGQNLPIHLTAATGANTRAPVIRPGILPGANAGVSTTSTTAVTGGQANTVTPGSMTNINIGSILLIYGGTGGAPEEVVVTAVTGSTFTANFANSHGGTYNIADRGKGHWLHAVTINAAGTGMTLTLYNGNPAFTYPGTVLGAGPFAVITPVAGASYIFDIDCDMDLWYSYTGTTPGDVTISYQPKP